PTHPAPTHPAPTRIWQRGYHDRVIRDARAMECVRTYIRRNPWRNVVAFENGMRGIGNPALWECRKIGMLCSRECPAETLAAAQNRAATAREQHCVLSGFHSSPEKAILDALLESKGRLICCPAWGIEQMKLPENWLPALEQNRMLILETAIGAADLASARARNRFVLDMADELWLPHVAPSGMLAALLKERRQQSAAEG
ncbi:MAG: hypothetical protein JXR37_10580, partial [Kiritimatiellae bacterium]|nr:hypothetical protein [Kiritimatiellia bacterium]